MSAVIINLPAPHTLSLPKMTIVTESGITVTLPYAPQEVQHGGHGYKFEETERWGRSPILSRVGNTLATMLFTATIARPDRAPIDAILDSLLHVIRSAERMRVGYTFLSSGLWNIVDDEIVEKDHEEGTNSIVTADVTLTFKKADQG